jgi:CBS domain containing-hemolysin-like protein
VTTIPALLATGTLLLLLTALLAAVETVLARLNVVRALRLAEEEQPGAARLLWLTEHRVTAMGALVTATVLARVASVTAFLVAASRAGTDGLAIAGVALVVALLHVLVGEVVPRTLTLRSLEAVALRLAGPAVVLVRVVDPLARALVVLGRAVVPARSRPSGPFADDDELRDLSDDEPQDEELEPEERAMIRSIFELADTIVREIMVPRPDIVSITTSAPLDDVVRTALDRGVSRLPVHEPDDPDVIVGIVHAKDLLRRLATEPGRTHWDDLVRAPTFVPETKRCDDLLRDLQAVAVHLALVVDEYGELVGLVTIEDILEEIVGEIVDEHDREEPLVEPLADGRLRVDARLGVDDLNELLGTGLPEEGWDTVGGLLVATFGRVPAPGESVELDRTTLTVEHVQGRRIGKVLVDPSADAVDDGGRPLGRGADGPADRGPAAAPQREASS